MTGVQTCALPIFCEGLTEIAITTNPGGVEHWKAIKAQELFAEHVVPVIQRETEAVAVEA